MAIIHLNSFHTILGTLLNDDRGGYVLNQIFLFYFENKSFKSEQKVICILNNFFEFFT